MKSITEIRNRPEVLKLLKDLHGRGYRYVVRDRESEWLLCYTLKPKKYRDTNSWGYVDPNASGVKMAYPFKNNDMTEINWTNRTAKPITDFIS